ncbi:aminoglycoside phosphotransferase family protein [Kribbella sandramycini]|uniref:Aminoglycoside phosphotransferase (APT) family kinase protein n=1 Tax=Kribbella sandramycini TaxID=60450 RepID=A0A7Y4L7M9_9ACTN|nr:aminoglycoside phosphotransferase family protein [Kribbella sandramycini]MBB6570237.1 aminoglycoside phosphotransferase (APT) family kinase protein [Kribbella sandramycini]NOL45910.1 aminoglycoside phosphotransferase family protein [Kribbella sandramycini]
MTEDRRPDADQWLAYFERRGYDAPRILGAGMEGVVYRLTEGLVAKVWSGLPPAEIALSRDVYAEVAHHALPFGTPEILDVEVHGGVFVSYERELAGAPFRSDPFMTDAELDIPAVEVAALLTVLRALATVPGTDAMRGLTVQGDDRPLWLGQQRFPDALAALVRRAVGRHGDVLAGYVPGLSATVERVVTALATLPGVPNTVIHGDLVPPNLHVEDDGRVVAVLDFGFFTTAGDPAFDAAVAAAVWDMYGPHAERHAATLTELFAAELGYPAETLALYQAVYALATYDLFSSGGSDGHFQWCAALLRRSRVGAARG